MEVGMKNKKASAKFQKISVQKRVLYIGLFCSLIIALGMFLFPKIQKTTKSVCANSISCIGDLSGKYLQGENSVFMGRQLPAFTMATTDTSSPVLGVSTMPKHIYVDLSKQQLTATEGTKEVFRFSVSTGKWRITPDGDFRIWIKIRNAHMEGGDQADGTYYNLYNVPYTMFYYNDRVPKSLGFSIHGAYWHNNFGHPMSHGCVNMRPEDAAQLYNWASPSTGQTQTFATDADPGTPVTITGTTPDE
jgi:hypothetical protein